MDNFSFYAPTYFSFGKGTETQAGSLVKRFGGSRVLIHYGGGSVIRSGLLDRVKKSLDEEKISYIELGGVKPNPRSGLVYEGISICRKENIDFILAVGGGSTIDSAKAIAAGTVYDGDFWDFYEGKPVTDALPVGTILTIAAAGSEGSPDSVITKEDGMIKRGASGEAYRPKFSILNPALTQTLSPYQTACGVTDIIAHLYTVDFLTKKKKVNEGEIPQYYVEGNHEAIIQPEIFELVQQELERRKNSRGRHSGVHLFSSKIKCGQCGEWYGSKVWHSNSKYRRVIWQCNHKYDGEEKCSTPHLTEDEIKTMFVSAVNKLISNKDAVLAPLRASLDIAFDTSALEAETEELQSEIMVTSDLIQKCICENAHVALDQTEYQKRYDGLTARFDSAKAQLEEIDSAIADKKSRRATIEAFMDTLAQADLMEKFDPALWCGLVDFVTVYSKDDVRFTFRNGMEIKA